MLSIHLTPYAECNEINGTRERMRMTRKRMRKSAPNASADGSGNNENKDHSIEWICEEMAGEERDEA